MILTPETDSIALENIAELTTAKHVMAEYGLTQDHPVMQQLSGLIDGGVEAIALEPEASHVVLNALHSKVQLEDDMSWLYGQATFMLSGQTTPSYLKINPEDEKLRLHSARLKKAIDCVHAQAILQDEQLVLNTGSIALAEIEVRLAA